MQEDNNNLADIGVIGLAVMGQNLILNMDDNGYKVVAYNRSVDKVERFLDNEAKNTNIAGAYSAQELVSKLKSPRKILLMVKAGKPVDDMIEVLTPLLSPGDIIIDGGNSLYSDTERRLKNLTTKNIMYVGAGISGGEEGARKGPSIMPGGNKDAWPELKDILQKISAKVDGNTACCEWVGEGGAGHYVKMVHNGIEYGDMQLIAESYSILKNLLGLTSDELSKVFNEWNQKELESYLIEITAKIFAKKDEDDQPLVEKILDTAGQKGTGKWTVISSAELGQPVSLISEAVYARCISSFKQQRIIASKTLDGPNYQFSGDKKEFIAKIEKALYASKVVSYAQGYMLMQAAAKENKWDLNYGGIALMWRGGCIIRSKFLGKIKQAFDNNPTLDNILIDPFFKQAISDSQQAWREVITESVKAGIPIPALSSALSFYDAYRSESLPANLIQAQRDFFGAHTYERIDSPKGEFFHSNWES